MRRCKSPDDKIIFVEGFYKGNSHLFLYENKEERTSILRSFLEAGIKKSELCVYVYPTKKDNKLHHPQFGKYADQFYRFPLIKSKKVGLGERHITKLSGKLVELGDLLGSKGYKALRLEIDLAGFVCPTDFEALAGLEGALQRCGEKFPMSHLCALEINSVDRESLEKLMRFHDRIFISTKNGSVVLLSQSSPVGPDIPSIDVMSQDIIEECVKNSLDVIVLALLKQQPMCGFDIIKTIVQRFNILLSQGVVYPLLYSLKEQGYLGVELKPDRKTRVYVPTEAGEKFIEKRIKEYAATQKRILDLTSSAIA